MCESGRWSRVACYTVVVVVKLDYRRSNDQCEICQSPLRPNIVWFSEEVMHLNLIQKKAINADLFVSIGTSNQVFPANSLVSLFKQMSKPTIELNLEKTVNSNQFDFGIYNKPATIAVEEFKNLLLESITSV